MNVREIWYDGVQVSNNSLTSWNIALHKNGPKIQKKIEEIKKILYHKVLGLLI